MSKDNNDYLVGKGHPPRHTRWKKGQSGNPSGRKKLPDPTDAAARILEQKFTVTVDGVAVDRLGEAASARYRRARIGLVFQFFNLLDDLTVADNVMLPAQLAGMARATAQRRATELLTVLGVDRHAAAYPGRLSGGERQRVAVARALMNRPALLLADEPTGALDTAAGEDVQRLLTELHADGQTIVLVTHDLALAERCATRTVQLRDGRVAADTTAPVR